MSNAFRDGLVQHIEQLEVELKGARAALHAYDNTQPKPAASGPDTRFQGMAPLKAIRTLLGESGGRMKRDDLIEAMIAGGAIIGKKRGRHNLRISIEVNVGNGNLIEDNGDVILPDNRR